MPSEASGRPELRTAQGPPADSGGCPGRRGRNCQHSCGAHGGTAVPAHLKRCRYSAVGKPTPRPSGWAGRKSTPPCPCTRARYALGSSGSDTLLRSLGPPARWRVESAHLGRELRRAPEAVARLRAAWVPLPRGVGATCAFSWCRGGRWVSSDRVGVLRQVSSDRVEGPFSPLAPPLGTPRIVRTACSWRSRAAARSTAPSALSRVRYEPSFR